MAKAKTTAYLLIFAAVLSVVSPTSAPISLPPSSPAPSFSTAPSPGPDCLEYLLKLSDCLSFVESGSNLTKPDPGCCSELANLVATQPICLCQLLGDPDKIGIPVDVNKALTLPSLCKVSTPPISLCSVIGVPIAGLAPTVSPSPSPFSPSAGDPGAASPSTGNEAVGTPGSFASNCKQNCVLGLVALLFTYFI